MEVDELDTGLLEQFGSLQTVDHADLVRQMRRLVGGEDAVSESCAKFYLEMSNWNVHSAVGHYFDLNGGAGPGTVMEKLPSMTFVRDVTIGEGESVPPSTRFTKTWTVLNSGTEAWPLGCCLKFTQGERLQSDPGQDRVAVGRCLRPGETADLSCLMTSPSQPGIYEAQWRMDTGSGAYFGDTIWVILTVEQSGTLALTQQMDQFHDLGRQTSTSWGSPPAPVGPLNGLSSPIDNNSVINPFAMTPPRHSIVRRPLSPTDSGQTVVSARNILERGLSENSPDVINNTGIEDEEMN